MAYLNKNDLELLNRVHEMLYELAKKNVLETADLETTVLYGNWILTQRDYGKEQRKLAAARVKEKRKTDPNYSRVSPEKQREYVKRYHEKKKRGGK